MGNATCCASIDGLWPCTGQPLPGAPFPLCVKHIAQVVEFANQARDHALDMKRVEARQTEQVGTIYYVRTGPFVKIGFTGNLRTRLKQYPPDAELLVTEVGTPKLEKQRHRQFEADLIGRTEWFHPSEALMAHIEALRQVSPAKRQGPMHPDGLVRIAQRATCV